VESDRKIGADSKASAFAAPHFDHVLLALSEFTDPRR
jgi:hypothetical protein